MVKRRVPATLGRGRDPRRTVPSHFGHSFRVWGESSRTEARPGRANKEVRPMAPPGIVCPADSLRAVTCHPLQHGIPAHSGVQGRNAKVSHLQDFLDNLFLNSQDLSYLSEIKKTGVHLKFF